MAWYNPWTWNDKPSTQSSSSVPSGSGSYREVIIQTTPTTTTTIKGGGGVPTTIIHGGSGGGSSSAPTASSISTTADTGTGYNPATGTNVPEDKPTIGLIKPAFSLPSVQSMGGFPTNRGTTQNYSRPTATSSNSSIMTGLSDFGSNYLYGEKSKKLVGINIPVGLGIGMGGTYTFENIKSDLGSSKYFGARVASELIPTTPLGVAGTVALPYGISRLPTIGRIAVGGVTTYLGAKTALNTNLTAEQRTAGGIIGGLGAVGTFAESYPFISGTTSKIFGKISNPVETISFGGKAVEIIPKVPSAFGGKSYDIALIPPSDLPTGNIPAFKSSAYGFSKEYQSSYIGKTGTVTTSARGLIPSGITKLTRSFDDYNLVTKKVAPNPEIFATPYDISTGMAQTRVSRLGSTDLFNFPEQSSFSFGISKPQIVSFPNAKIATTGTQGTFLAKPFTTKAGSSELEVTTTSKIYGTKVGTTKIGLSKVDLYSAKLFKLTDTIPNRLIKISSGSSYTTPSTTSSYSAFSVSSAFKIASPSMKVSSSSIPSSVISRSLNIDYSTPKVSSRVSTGSSYTPPSTPSYTPSGFSYPSSPSAPPSFPSTPSYTPSGFSYPSSPPSTPFFPSFGFDFDFGNRNRRIKGRQRKKYTPSFESLVFNIRGKAPKGTETGFRTRPIPKGYSFAYKTSPTKFGGKSFKPVFNF